MLVPIVLFYHALELSLLIQDVVFLLRPFGYYTFTSNITFQET